MQRQYFVYLLASAPYGTLYVGITNDVLRRVWEYRNDLVEAFSREYQTHRLVWYEIHESPYAAITREKSIKRWRRDWKVNLIQRMNPEWRDLYESLTAYKLDPGPSAR